MAGATADERVLMAREVERRELQFLEGAVKQGLAKDTNEAKKFLTASVVNQLSWYTSDAAETAARLLDGIRPHLATWRSTWMDWAKAGQRKGGSDYTVKQWFAFSDNLGTQIQQATKQAGESGLKGYLDFTAANTANQVKGAAAWVSAQLPTAEQLRSGLFWVKAGGVVLGAAVVLCGTAYVVRSFK
ncbi:MAG TPA: hypothetical protein VEU33_28945 [Archangium sp.]|nr:hypothetical protein [Archangium sp.]